MALTLAQTVFQLWLGRYFLPVQQKHLLAFSSEQTQPEYTRKEYLYFTANCWHNTLSSLADLIPKNSLLPKSDPNKVPGTQFLVPGTKLWTCGGEVALLFLIENSGEETRGIASNADKIR